MPKWGPDKTQTFEIASGGLTANFADNVRVGDISNTDKIVIAVEYTKGTEDWIEVTTSFSLGEDRYHPISEKYFDESALDASTGELLHQPYIMKTSGTYRFDILSLVSEDRFKCFVRGVGAGTPFTGSVKLYYAADNPGGG